MKNDTFLDYLSTKHADGYMGTDDNMPDSFEKYLESLDTDELIDFADEWAVKILEFAQLKVKQIKGVYSAHDALEAVDKVLSDLQK